MEGFNQVHFEHKVDLQPDQWSQGVIDYCEEATAKCIQVTAGHVIKILRLWREDKACPRKSMLVVEPWVLVLTSQTNQITLHMALLNRR